jgi:hypothetical protein
MRLDFNVLWIDDQPANMSGYKDNLAIKTRREGFKLNVVQEVSFENARQYLANDIFLDNIDLVLVDYDLGAGTKGDDAVQEIRRAVPYKDIVFYSAIPTANLKQMVLDKGIEGVFCAHREELGDKLGGVFEALVKKVLDVDHCRGIVMGVTSDIDQIVLDCLLQLLPNLNSEQDKTATDYALKKLDVRLARFNEERAKLAADGVSNVLPTAHEAIPSADRLGLLKKVLGLYYENAHVELRQAVGKYNSEVPQQRNELGHVRLVAADGIRRLRGRDGTEITSEKLRLLRQTLIDYRDEFETLANLVGIAIA